MNKRSQDGFTLYELLITVMIIGIVLMVGIPNLSEFRQNGRMTSTANNLLSSFHLARSEAARAKAPITICASANSMTAAANCGGTFEQGWIVFIDLNGDLLRAGAGENVLRPYPATPTGITITTNANSNYFGFAGTGLGRGDVGGQPALQTVMICDDRGLQPAVGGRATARRLVATPIGRATIISDLAMIQAAGAVCP
jgi:type IV fimbrial biogenesis protein FimT